MPLKTPTRTLVLTALAVVALGVAPALARKGKHKKAPDADVCAALKSIDGDNDGKLELAEAKKAAESAFDRLNADKDQSLDRKELKGHLSKKQEKAGDTDNDGTLDKAEFVAIVEKLFTAANTDKDNALDCAELKSKAGRAMMRLLM